jgi:hypothetical protein
MGLVDASLVDACGRGYMNSTRSSCHAEKIAVNYVAVKSQPTILVATKCILLKRVAPCAEGLYADNRLKIRGKFGLGEAGERIVEFYEAWGKKEKAAEWRAKLGKTPTEVKSKP